VPRLSPCFGLGLICYSPVCVDEAGWEGGKGKGDDPGLNQFVNNREGGICYATESFRGQNYSDAINCKLIFLYRSII
jgi:hypothetical protein